jgi:hypothetical protein
LKGGSQKAANDQNTTNDRDAKPVDPFEALRGVRDSYLESMSKVMVNAVNSEEYAQATGALLNGYLTLTAPAREALDKAMLQALEQFSLPSRQQVTVLAERLTNIETRCDDMDAKLDRILELSRSKQPAETADPSAAKRAAANGTRTTHPRTRKR